MLLFKKNQIEYGLFERLKQYSNIRHATIFRSDNNTSFHRDEARNTCSLLESTFSFQQFCFCHLQHSNNVIVVENAQDSIAVMGQADGLITVQKGVTLVMSHADCQAAIFYDPVLQVIGNVHSGWRGNVQNIYKQCVDKMVKTFGCQRGDIIVCIAPSLGPNHSQFINYQQELPTSFLPFMENQNFFNLWSIAEWQLLESGIVKENIEFANICSYEEESLCYSYRRDGTHMRNATLVQLI